MEKKEEEQEYCPYRERLDLDEFETKLGFDTPHQPEKQPWEERFDEAFGRFSLGENNGREKGWRSIDMLKPFISQLLKEEQPCLCKDKGVIELIEEAVEAERARIQEQIQKEGVENDSVWGKGYNAGLFTALRIVQVINKEEIPRNPHDQNKWM